MADDLECDEDQFEIDFRRLKDEHIKAGYKEGLDSGEESTLQQGFNEGFTDGIIIGQETLNILGTISALFCYIDSKKIPSLDEVKEELFKIKEDVEHLQIKYLKDYENLVTATNKDSITTAECFSSKNNEQRNENCCGKNATKDSSKCCSEESESVKCESGRKTDCCAENSEISGTWTIAQDRKLSDGFSTNVKDRTKGLLETLRKEVEIIEKQLATLIENKICSHLKK